jgi:hypothetical protein
MAMHYFHLSNGHTIMDQEGIDQPVPEFRPQRSPSRFTRAPERRSDG